MLKKPNNKVKTLKELRKDKKEQERRYVEQKTKPYLDKLRKLVESYLLTTANLKRMALYTVDAVGRAPEFKEKGYIDLAVRRLNEELKEANHPFQVVVENGEKYFEGNSPGYGGRDEWVYELKMFLRRNR